MGVETYNRKTAIIELKKFCYSDKDSDYIEVVEWKNGEGYSVSIEVGGRKECFDISHGELDALNYLVTVLDYEL